MTKSFQTLAAQLAAAAFVLLCACLLTFAIDALTHPYLPAMSAGRISLLYLPHGVKVLLAWMFGWLSLAAVLPVTLIYAVLYLGPENFTWTMAAIVVLKGIAVPLGFEITKLMGLDLRRCDESGLRWRQLFIVGFITSVMNQMIRYSMKCCGTLSVDEQLFSIGSGILADIMGLLAIMVVAMLVFRWLQRTQLQRVY